VSVALIVLAGWVLLSCAAAPVVAALCRINSLAERRERIDDIVDQLSAVRSPSGRRFFVSADAGRELVDALSAELVKGAAGQADF